MTRRLTNEDKFKQVEKLFHRAVSVFVKRYRHALSRLSVDEVVSAAGEGFADACADYDGTRGKKFSSWVWTKIWGKMLDDLRKAFRKSRRSFARVYDLAEEEESPEFDRQEFMSKLTPDGRLAASLVLDNPIDLEFIKVLLGGDTAWYTREAVRQYLIQVEEWSRVRVSRAFAEVKEALK